MELAIIDVTPRDGLQDTVGWVPTEVKYQLLDGIWAAGYLRVEDHQFCASPMDFDAAECRSRGGVYDKPLRRSPWYPT